jgi:hypothetical protein
LDAFSRRFSSRSTADRRKAARLSLSAKTASIRAGANFHMEKNMSNVICIYHGKCADGFTAAWAVRQALGVGRHFGEWWGQGIQRKYGLTEKRWSLFNVSKWAETRPACCRVVPTLWRGDFDTNEIARVMADLAARGSVAAPGFMKPEGVVIFHAQANVLFKKTFEKDDAGKGKEPTPAAQF